MLILFGFTVLGWLIVRSAPGLLMRPTSVMTARPKGAGLYGMLAAHEFVFVPLASVLLLVVMVVFSG